jgi:hypothetical protein
MRAQIYYIFTFYNLLFIFFIFLNPDTKSTGYEHIGSLYKKTVVMKKILPSLLIMLTLFGCQDNILSNSPVLRGLQNGDFVWRSSYSTVVVDASTGLTISGTDDTGTLTLQVPTVALGTFVLGADATAFITYSVGNTTYSTKNNGNTSIVYLGDGAINIDELDSVNGTVTGSFYFNAYTADGERGINFSEGIIYKLPVSEGAL